MRKTLLYLCTKSLNVWDMINRICTSVSPTCAKPSLNDIKTIARREAKKDCEEPATKYERQCVDCTNRVTIRVKGDSGKYFHQGFFSGPKSVQSGMKHFGNWKETNDLFLC